MGNDDIFSATTVCGVQQRGVTDAKTSAISNATVVIVDDKGNSIATEQSNEKGEVRYAIE